MVQIHLPFAVNVTPSLSLHCLLLVIDPEPPHTQLASRVWVGQFGKHFFGWFDSSRDFVWVFKSI